MILLEHACKWLIFIPIIESEFDFQRYNIELEDIPSDRFHSHFHILYIFIPIFRSCTFSFSCPVRFHFQVHFHVLFHFHFSEVILWLHTSYLVDTTSELAATHRIINWQIWATLHIYSTRIQHSLLQCKQSWSISYSSQCVSLLSVANIRSPQILLPQKLQWSLFLSQHQLIPLLEVTPECSATCSASLRRTRWWVHMDAGRNAMICIYVTVTCSFTNRLSTLMTLYSLAFLTQ